MLQCCCFVVAVHGHVWAWSQDAAGHVCGRAGSRGTGCGVRRQQAQVLPEVSEGKVSPVDHQGLEQGTTRIQNFTMVLILLGTEGVMRLCSLMTASIPLSRSIFIVWLVTLVSVVVFCNILFRFSNQQLLSFILCVLFWSSDILSA